MSVKISVYHENEVDLKKVSEFITEFAENVELLEEENLSLTDKVKELEDEIEELKDEIDELKSTIKESIEEKES